MSLKSTMSKIRDPTNRVRFAVALLVVSFIGWPVSMLTWAKHEPPTMLALSWFAVILTAINIIATTDVRREQDDQS